MVILQRPGRLSLVRRRQEDSQLPDRLTLHSGFGVHQCCWQRLRSREGDEQNYERASELSGRQQAD